MGYGWDLDEDALVDPESPIGPEEDESKRTDLLQEDGNDEDVPISRTRV
jgi:hypothetical protein